MAGFRKKFIVFDLETTHLDSAAGRILEFGGCEAAVFFDGKKNEVAVEFGKSFSTLVNPEIEIPIAANAITGIAKEDALKAPKWKEVKPQIEEFLKDGVLVGHNVQFDIGYLENQGIKVKNQSMDTLEIAQTLQPFFSSHSLENLGEAYGVAEDAPHRALADSQNTARVLASVLNDFLSYPSEIQGQIREIAEKSNLSFAPLFSDLPKVSRSQKAHGKETKPRQNTLNLPKIPLKDRVLYKLPIRFADWDGFLADLSLQKQNLWAGLSHPVDMLAIPQEQLLSPPDAVLDESALERLLSAERIEPPLGKVLIKSLLLLKVKNSTNLSLLKWHFGELRYWPFLTGAPSVLAASLEKNKVYFSSLGAMFRSAEKTEGKKMKALLFDLPAIEDTFTGACARTWSLRRIREQIALLFPIEKNLPSILESVPKYIEKLANELDLFFGILHLIYLQKEGGFAQNLVADHAERDSQRFSRLLHPSEKLCEKISQTISGLEESEVMADENEKIYFSSLRESLSELKEFLTEFFQNPAEKNLHWLKFNDSRVDLNIQPRDLGSEWKKFSEKFESVSIIDTGVPAIALEYYQNRLGISGYQIERIRDSKQTEKISVRLADENFSDGRFYEFLLSLSGRTLVVLPNENRLAETYEEMFERSSDKLSVLAGRYSGSPQAIRKKIKAAEEKNICLLLTTNQILRYWDRLPEFENLVLVKLPFEAGGSKPALLGLDRGGAFVSAVLPRAVSQLHRIFTKFAAQGEKRKTIFVLDPRADRDYDGAFRKYLEEFPDFSIENL